MRPRRILRAALLPFSKPLTRAYTWLAHCPLLCRNPALYIPFRRHVGYHVMKLWRDDPRTGIPDKHTELMIASPGHCASHSLLAYLWRHNPGRDIQLCAHVPALVVYAVQRGIPCLVLSRDMLGWIGSSYCSRFVTGGQNPFCFYKTIAPVLDRVCVSSWPEPMDNPAAIVRRINERYGMDLNEGDNVLPRIKVYRSDGDAPGLNPRAAWTELERAR